MQRCISQTCAKHNWQLIDRIHLTSMLNLHPDVNKQNETLVANTIRCKQKMEFWPVHWTLNSEPSWGQLGDMLYSLETKSANMAAAWCIQFKFTNEYSPSATRDGFSKHIRFQLEVSSGGVINVPPRRNHDTAATHNSGSLSSKVMMHSCRVGPFSDVLWMCWLKGFRQRLWEKYKSNQVSQTLHAKKWLHFKRRIFVRSVSDVGVISLALQRLKQYIHIFIWAPEINHHQVLCYHAQVTLFSRVLHHYSSLITTNLTGNIKTIFTDMGVYNERNSGLVTSATTCMQGHFRVVEMM